MSKLHECNQMKLLPKTFEDLKPFKDDFKKNISKYICSFSGKKHAASICSLLETKPLMTGLFRSKLLLTH